MVDWRDRYHSNISHNWRLLEACPKAIYRQIIKAGREPSVGNEQNTLADRYQGNYYYFALTESFLQFIFYRRERSQYDWFILRFLVKRWQHCFKKWRYRVCGTTGVHKSSITHDFLQSK